MGAVEKKDISKKDFLARKHSWIVVFKTLHLSYPPGTRPECFLKDANGKFEAMTLAVPTAWNDEERKNLR